MKAVSKLIALLLVGLSPAFAASASTMEESYLETCLKAPGVPVPVSVVSPAVGSEYEGATVQLEFLVGVDGKPADFSVKSATDTMLATAVVDAVKQWRFMPAEVDGKPVAKKVALPVKIVEPAVPGTRYVARD